MSNKKEIREDECSGCHALIFAVVAAGIMAGMLWLGSDYMDTRDSAKQATKDDMEMQYSFIRLKDYVSATCAKQEKK